MYICQGEGYIGYSEARSLNVSLLYKYKYQQKKGGGHTVKSCAAYPGIINATILLINYFTYSFVKFILVFLVLREKKFDRVHLV